jgi:hypothetical protein
MIRLYVRHAVEDFDRWLAGYRARADLRARHGVKADGVHRGVDDPNDVTVWHDFETADEAAAYAAAPELRDAMATLGVKGAPLVWAASAS